MATFSDRLQEAISIKGIKPIDLSKTTGIGKSAISNYINGKYNAKQINTFKLAKALDVSEAWLMGLDAPMERSYPELNPNDLSQTAVKIGFSYDNAAPPIQAAARALLNVADQPADTIAYAARNGDGITSKSVTLSADAKNTLANSENEDFD